MVPWFLLNRSWKIATFQFLLILMSWRLVHRVHTITDFSSRNIESIWIGYCTIKLQRSTRLILTWERSPVHVELLVQLCDLSGFELSVIIFLRGSTRQLLDNISQKAKISYHPNFNFWGSLQFTPWKPRLAKLLTSLTFLTFKSTNLNEEWNLGNLRRGLFIREYIGEGRDCLYGNIKTREGIVNVRVGRKARGSYRNMRVRKGIGRNMRKGREGNARED